MGSRTAPFQYPNGLTWFCARVGRRVRSIESTAMTDHKYRLPHIEVAEPGTTPQLLHTLRDVARITDTSYRTVRAAAQHGELPTMVFLGRRMALARDVSAWIKANMHLNDPRSIRGAAIPGRRRKKSAGSAREGA